MPEAATPDWLARRDLALLLLLYGAGLRIGEALALERPRSAASRPGCAR